MPGSWAYGWRMDEALELSAGYEAINAKDMASRRMISQRPVINITFNCSKKTTHFPLSRCLVKHIMHAHTCGPSSGWPRTTNQEIWKPRSSGFGEHPKTTVLLPHHLTSVSRANPPLHVCVYHHENKALFKRAERTETHTWNVRHLASH